MRRTFLKSRGAVVESDGVTVWVNDAYGCIGRFGYNGIDVHRNVKDQRDKGECLHCTHSPTINSDWSIFVLKMNQFHQITVPEKHKPDRFKLNEH